jgi:hypothetical protein
LGSGGHLFEDTSGSDCFKRFTGESRISHEDQFDAEVLFVYYGPAAGGKEKAAGFFFRSFEKHVEQLFC